MYGVMIGELEQTAIKLQDQIRAAMVTGKLYELTVRI